MPTWGRLLLEIKDALKLNDNAYDVIREKYIAELHAYTGRNTIVYATDWTTGDTPTHLTSLTDEDIHGFMEAIYGLEGEELDLVLHTPGGSAEAVDAIVSYLRQKFKHIRVIIPQAAMSAGTMLACSADVIVMGKHSSIGPIDPQIYINTPYGSQYVPAQSIKDQFDKIREEFVSNRDEAAVWVVLLHQYAPALLVTCENQIKFAKELVETWLRLYMFNGDGSLASTVAEFLSNHNNFRTHTKHINITGAINIGLKVEQLEDNQEFQSKVLSAFHATIHALSNTPVCKIIANHNGNAFIKTQKKDQSPLETIKPSRLTNK
jgi:hypothetical protein